MISLKELNGSRNGNHTINVQNGHRGTAYNRSPSAKENPGQPSLLQQAVCLILFMTLGPSLIMINKYILKDLGFSFPITHTFYTSAFCSVTVWIASTVFGWKRPHANMITFEFYMRNVMPIGFFLGATIVLGMSSYLYLTVSFVQMLKASTPVMIVSFLKFFGIESPTIQILSSVLIICFGTVLSGYGEIKFELIGVFLMLSGQVAEALRLVFTQKLLKNLKFDILESLCYVTPAATLWVFVAAIIFELPKMTSQTFEIVTSNLFLWILAGCFAVGVNAINSVVIKFTGSLMMKLLATARNASLVIFNVIFMAEAVSFVQFCGYTISLAGFMMYNYYRTKK
eukprot:CAMPEP_0114521314 /NCGR_PEP_ID=MMETSP0109-20121206/20116_1 /TAXON_ID=29199 /ORGANISM="Chlorarachnion reptans, Strain CCCM449" /LENGTH=340 /DNA_ID=CAMNT_0001702403 /DNA_START=125 /DNA_END=1147 /DNA_ORIENTATION=+